MENHEHPPDPGDPDASLTGEAETPARAEPARERAGMSWALIAVAVAVAVGAVFLIAFLI